VSGLSRHLADRDALRAVAVPLRTGGLVLGRDQQGQPVATQLFRPTPTLVAVVGRWWLGRLLVFRALALGARVAVRTAWPNQWNGLGEPATNQSDRLAVLPVNQVAEFPASIDEPGLHVLDMGPDVGRPAIRLGPWQAQVVLLPQLTPGGLAVLERAPLAVFQRVSPAEATLAAGPLALSPEVARYLTVIPDDAFAVFGGGEARYGGLAPTELELQFLGPPQVG
jgi:hypothetical protein